MKIRSTVIGTSFLAVLLTAGAAQSLAGSNTVHTDDIVDGTIATRDLKPGSVSGSRLLDNAVTGAKVYPDTLTGADIKESTLTLPPGPPGPAGRDGSTKTYVWTKTLVNVPTQMTVDSTDMVPSGARVQATSIEVTSSRSLPETAHVQASVNGGSLANFSKDGDQIDKVIGPERLTTADSSLRYSIVMSATATDLTITLRFTVKDPEEVFD